MHSPSAPNSDLPRIDVPSALAPLAARLACQFAYDHVEIESCERLSGGAIQENWLLSASVLVHGEPIEKRWVLRTDAPSSVAVSMGRAQEFAVLQAVHQAGVTVPDPLWLCRDPGILGRDFFLMAALEGTASGFRLTTDKALEPARRDLCRELGANLALLHEVKPDHAELDFLHAAAIDPIQRDIDLYRQYLDELPIAHPVIEWGLRWCELNRPDALTPRLIHRDYRTGNYMVDQGCLVGVLDWEFAGWGDPREDLGWFTARCWRFARPDREAGGIGQLDDFLEGYSSVSGLRPTLEELRFWQLMAHVRWALIALQQAQRHLTGQQRSLELALTGRLIPELEYEILSLTGARP